jgi:hypothetical protein
LIIINVFIEAVIDKGVNKHGELIRKCSSTQQKSFSELYRYPSATQLER